jgi:hypothetical protein
MSFITDNAGFMNVNFTEILSFFGQPNEGIHQLHIFGLAFWDVLLSLILAFAITRCLKRSFVMTFIALFIIAEAMHIDANVQTGFLSLIGVDVHALNARKPYCEMNFPALSMFSIFTCGMVLITGFTNN